MNKTFNFCNNCGKNGHQFNTCKYPITSIGLICFRINDNKIEYIMIKRKHSLGFVEFMRGKYPLYNYKYLLNIFNEMSIDEKNKIKTYTFDELWNYLWGNDIGIQYNLDTLIEESNTNWIEPEWGFPKGRRNYNENDLNCALREFEEETGILKSNIKLIQNIIPYEEIFTGSNMKSYKHKYFIGNIDNNIKNTFDFQETEVSEVIWLEYDECINKIRPYNLEKINILNKVNKVLQEYRLY